MISAKVICDSIDSLGNRITTMEVVFPRIILPQLLTHRVFSRNTASSRAIPVNRLIARVREHPFFPHTFNMAKKGMVAGEALDKETQIKAMSTWSSACSHAIQAAEQLLQLNVSKEHANRLLEPFSYVNMLITSTEWKNFFSLRISDDAQPEIQTLAICMHHALYEAKPKPLEIGMWHMPYSQNIEGEFDLKDKLFICSGRCARVSYLTHDGKSDAQKDLDLGKKLLQDRHLSPLEHIARCMNDETKYANFKGWASYRELIRSDMMRHYIPWDSWLSFK